jgi:hypothetical protein
MSHLLKGFFETNSAGTPCSKRWGLFRRERYSIASSERRDTPALSVKNNADSGGAEP